MSTTITAEAVYAAQVHNWSDGGMTMDRCSDFVALVGRVRAKSPEAAGILETMALDPDAKKKWDFVPSASLLGVFPWAQTSEGHEFWSDLHASISQVPTVQAAERVSEKFQELASVLQEWDTSAAEASKAFQDLQDMAASSPLDAEQIRKDADILASFHGVPREPWYKRLWSWLRGTK